MTHVIREQAELEQQLHLTEPIAPLVIAPFEAAGWVLDSQHVVYETDLHALSYPLDPHAQTVDPDRPDIRGLLEQLGQPDLGLSPSWTLIALPGGDGSPVALGAVGPSGRPGSASINLIGVLPQGRGQGLGTRLHAHLMALAA